MAACPGRLSAPQRCASAARQGRRRTMPKQTDTRDDRQYCDSHFHVFGRADKYPVGADLRYTPPIAELDDYVAHVRPLGLTRYVFVQPSAYGRDNSCMLDAMRAMDPATRRGIVDVEADAPDALLAELDALGVCG